MKPWERYQQPAAPAAPPPAGPWQRYAPSAPQGGPAGPSAPTTSTMLASGPLPSQAEAQIASSAMGGRLNEALGEQASKLPGYVADELQTTGTHYRQLGRMAGLSLDPPAPEDRKAYQQAVIEMLLTTGGGKLGQMAGNTIGEIGKYLGRGFRTPSGLERFMAREAAHMIPGGAPAKVGMRELAAPALSGTAVGIGVNALDPTPWELTDAGVSGTAGVATAAGVARNTIDDLLLQNPRYRDLVTRGTGGSPFSTAIGATLGYLLSKGIEIGADGVDDVIQFFAPDDVPGPQAGASDISGPLPPRSAQPMPMGLPPRPLNEQQLIAQRLLA